MAVFKNWEYMIYLLIIQSVGLLGWLCNFASAQVDLSESVTGSISFPNIGIACLGNLAVFVTSLLRIRVDLEMGARDIMATVRGPKLEDIKWFEGFSFGLTTCNDKQYSNASVVMLTHHPPNISIKQFMKYISNAYNVQSIVLRCIPLEIAAATVDIETCNCDETCGCIVFRTVEDITKMLVHRMPRILKRVSYCLCLLPSLNCLTKGCHGCNLDVKAETGELTQHDGPTATSPSPLCGILQQFPDCISEEHSCICIPMRPEGNDEWTKLLARSFGVKVTEEADVEPAWEYYSTASLIVPKFAEVLINILLTGWFRVDGFSSALIARRAIKENVVDKKGSGFAANAFLTKALAKVSSDKKSNDAGQVLVFRDSLLGMRTFSFLVGCVNLFCSITWALLLAMEEGAGKWYDTHSMPPSQFRVVVIMVAIAISFAMDCLHLYLCMGRPKQILRISIVSVGIVLEILWMVSGSIALKTLDVKNLGKWLYSALHVFVWVKWAIGSFLLGEYPPEYDTQQDYDNGILVYSSAFLLNSILAGVRGNWYYSLSMEN